MDLPDPHDKLIALVQGDLVEDAEVLEVLQDLMASPENRSLFLEYLNLELLVSSGIQGVVPGTDSDAGVWNKIRGYEADKKNAGVSSAGSHKYRRLAGIAVLVLLLLLVGGVVGFLLMKSTTVTGSSEKMISLGAEQIPFNGIAGPVFQLTYGEPSGTSSSDTSVADQSESRMRVSQGGEDLIRKGHEVLTPNGGEILLQGSRIPLMWEGKDEKGPVSVMLSTSGGMTWDTLLSGVTNKRQVLWDVGGSESDECLVKVAAGKDVVPVPNQPFPHEMDRGNAIDVSPDGRMLVTASLFDVFFWDVKTRKLIKSFQAHRGSIILLRFSKDGTKVIAGSIDSTASIIDVRTMAVEQVFHGKRGRIWPAVFSPDGDTVATGNDDGSITLWDVASGEEIETFEAHSEAVRYLEYDPTGKFLMAASTDQTASIINVGERIPEMWLPHFMAERRKATDPIVNGIQLVLDDSLAITCGFDGTTKFWNTYTEKLIRTRSYHGGRETSEVRLGPDGSWFVSAGYDGRVLIVDTHTGAVLFEISVDSAVPRTAYNASAEELYVMHGNGKISAWHLPLDRIDISDRFWSIQSCIE